MRELHARNFLTYVCCGHSNGNPRVLQMNSWSDTFLWSFLAALLIWILIRLWYKLTSGQCAFEESLKGKVFLVTGCTSGKTFRMHFIMVTTSQINAKQFLSGGLRKGCNFNNQYSISSASSSTQCFITKAKTIDET